MHNVLLQGATVIPCDGGAPIENSQVHIEQGRIASVTVSGVRPDPALDGRDVERIDVSGKYIIPGLVDAHIHLDQHGVAGTTRQRLSVPTESLIINSVRNAVLNLSRGVTAVRDLGAKGASNITVRDAISAGVIAGPRVLAAGEMISQTGGHGQGMTTEVDGPDNIRRVVRLRAKQRADVVKLCLSGGVSEAKQGESPQVQEFTEEEIRAGIDEAHRLGLRVTVHAHPVSAIRIAAENGVDSVEHGAYLDGETAELLRSRGIVLVPTLDNAFTVAREGKRLGRPDWMIQNAAASLDLRMKAARIAVEAEVPIAIGTDILGRIDSEMQHLHEAGLSRMKALEGATRIGADLLGLTDRGVVRAGYAADLLVLRQNPLEVLNGFQSSIDLVFKDGERYRPSDLLSALPDSE